MQVIPQSDPLMLGVKVVSGWSLITGLDYWTGTLDWTTGLSFISIFMHFQDYK